MASAQGRLAGKNAVITGAGGYVSHNETAGWHHVTDSIFFYSGIGLETSILFAREGASILMTDKFEGPLQKAKAKVLQLVPNAVRVEAQVSTPAHERGDIRDSSMLILGATRLFCLSRSATSRRKAT